MLDQSSLLWAIKIICSKELILDHGHQHCDLDLNDRETSTSEVEEYIANAPAHRALPSEVHVRLRNIPAVRINMNKQNIWCGCRWCSFNPLYYCDPQFDIGEVVEHVQPGDDGDGGEDEDDPDEDGDAQQDCQAPFGHLLVSPLEDEALK